MLVALFGVLALGALTASAAQAVEAPRWSVAGTTLGANETHYITAKIYTTKEFPRFTLIAAGRTISCLGARLNPGVLLGSSAGNAGKNNEVIEFFGNCTVAGNGGNCKVTEPIVTNPVKSELVETEKATGTSGSLLTLFEPEGTSGFVKLGFTGSECIVTETIVSGKVAAQVLTDPENGELGKLVELPKVNSAEAKSWLLNAPAEPIKKVTRFSGGATSEIKVELVAFSATATLSGTALVLLAKKNSSGGFESETTLWSPLP
jgi:hypothetical protein